MTDKILHTIKRYDMIQSGDSVLCGVSGGADSCALLLSLCELSSELNIKVYAAHFNHNLRGEESDRDEDFVNNLCREHNVELVLGSMNVLSEAEKMGKSVEETARILRYNFFVDACEDLCCNKIATAHNANDNTETVLFNLARGTGIQGLCGIPPVRDNIIRPLIECTRDEIENYLFERGERFVVDSTNSDVKYSRNRIRHNVVPELLSINPALHSSISNMSRLLRADAGYITGRASEVLDSCTQRAGDILIPVSLFSDLGSAVSGRFIQLVALKLGINGGDLSSAHAEQVLNLCKNDDPSASIDLPCGLVVRREYEVLVFTIKGREYPTFIPQVLSLNESVSIESVGMKITCSFVDENTKLINRTNVFFVDCDKIKGSLKVRPRAEGDSISLLGRNCSKALKKLFIDEKVPRHLREAIPVISDNFNVIAVAGFGIDENFAATQSKNALKIEISVI